MRNAAVTEHWMFHRANPRLKRESMDKGVRFHLKARRTHCSPHSHVYSMPPPSYSACTTRDSCVMEYE